MACIIVFNHFSSGLEDLTLELLSDSGNVANGEPDALAEPEGKPYRYEAAVSQSLSGWYTARVRDSIGVLYTGRVKVANDGGTYLIDDPAATVADIGDVIVDEVAVASFTTAALQQLAGTRQINITVPTLLGRHLTDPLVRGDSYLASLDSAIEFSRGDFPDIPDEATATLTARLQDCDETVSFSISGPQASIPVKTGNKVVRFEPTAAQTAAWEPGKYEFDVEITFPGGAKRTFVGPGAFLRVIDDVTK